MDNILTLIGFFVIVTLIHHVLKYIELKDFKEFNKNNPIDIAAPLSHYPEEESFQLREDFDKKAYLKSRKWQALRTIILGRDHHTCRKCGIDDVPLEVHHIHYDNLGEELPEDLLTLCRDCHQSIHDKYGYSLYGYYPID